MHAILPPQSRKARRGGEGGYLSFFHLFFFSNVYVKDVHYRVFTDLTGPSRGLTVVYSVHGHFAFFDVTDNRPLVVVSTGSERLRR